MAARVRADDRKHSYTVDIKMVAMLCFFFLQLRLRAGCAVLLRIYALMSCCNFPFVHPSSHLHIQRDPAFSRSPIFRCNLPTARTPPPSLSHVDMSYNFNANWIRIEIMSMMPNTVGPVVSS